MTRFRLLIAAAALLALGACNEDAASPLPQNASQALTDTDGDGLNDLEEEDLGTDPNNPDTDGDGVSDGDEVDSGTDPLTPDQNALDTPAGDDPRDDTPSDDPGDDPRDPSDDSRDPSDDPRDPSDDPRDPSDRPNTPGGGDTPDPFDESISCFYECVSVEDDDVLCAVECSSTFGDPCELLSYIAYTECLEDGGDQLSCGGDADAAYEACISELGWSEGPDRDPSDGGNTPGRDEPGDDRPGNGGSGDDEWTLEAECESYAASIYESCVSRGESLNICADYADDAFASCMGDDPMGGRQ